MSIQNITKKESNLTGLWGKNDKRERTNIRRLRETETESNRELRMYSSEAGAHETNK